MNWFILTLVSALFFSLTAVMQRVLMREKYSNPYAHAVAFQVTVAVLIYLYTITFSQFRLSSLDQYIPNIILMTVLYALGNVFLFKSFKLIEASEVVVLRATFSIWVLLWSAIFLSEAVGIVRIIGTILVILGVMITMYRGEKWKLNKGTGYGLIAAFFFGSAFTNDAFLVNTFHVPSYMTLAFLFPGLAILLLKPKTTKDLGFYIDKIRLAKLIAVSSFYAVAAVTIFLAYQAGGDASQVSPIGQSSIVLTVLLSFIFLNERDYMRNKIVGSLFVFIGVFLLV